MMRNKMFISSRSAAVIVLYASVFYFNSYAVVAAANEVSQKVMQLEQTEDRVQSLKTQLAPKTFLLERERDRAGKLRQELLGDIAAGCWAQQPIRKIEILVKGAPIERDKVATPSKHLKRDDGSATRVTYMLGHGIVHVNSDEKQQSTIHPSGRVIFSELPSRKIADIEYIAIEKGGVGYFSMRECWSGFLGIGGGCGDKHFEDFRYRVDSITVKVNDQVLYQNNLVNRVLKDGSLRWSDSNITANSEYMKLMSRTDCQL